MEVESVWFQSNHGGLKVFLKDRNEIMKRDRRIIFCKNEEARDWMNGGISRGVESEHR